MKCVQVVRVWYCNRRQKEKRINPPSAMTHHIVQYYATSTTPQTPPPATPTTATPTNGRTAAITLTPVSTTSHQLAAKMEMQTIATTETVVTHHSSPAPEPTLEMTVN